MSLHFGSKIAAFLVSAWVYLVISLLGAYLISFYFSASTIIYYLMRREVDATELDDVYLEQSDDEFAEPTAGAVGPGPGAGVAVTTTTTTVVTEPGPAAPVDTGPSPSMPIAPPVEPAVPPPPPPEGAPPV